MYRGVGIEAAEKNSMYQVLTFFLESELHLFWLHAFYIIVLLKIFGYTPLNERSTDSNSSRHFCSII